MGVGEAAATPTLQVIAANFVPSALRSRYWGVVSAALAVGSIAAYELTPPLIDSRGWAAAFEVYGAAGVALARVGAVGASAPAVPEGCREPKLLGDSAADGASSSTSTSAAPPSSRRCRRSPTRGRRWPTCRGGGSARRSRCGR